MDGTHTLLSSLKLSTLKNLSHAHIALVFKASPAFKTDLIGFMPMKINNDTCDKVYYKRYSIIMIFIG